MVLTWVLLSGLGFNSVIHSESTKFGPSDPGGRSNGDRRPLTSQRHCSKSGTGILALIFPASAPIHSPGQTLVQTSHAARACPKGNQPFLGGPALSPPTEIDQDTFGFPKSSSISPMDACALVIDLSSILFFLCSTALHFFLSFTSSSKTFTFSAIRLDCDWE